MSTMSTISRNILVMKKYNLDYEGQCCMPCPGLSLKKREQRVSGPVARAVTDDSESG